MHSKFFALIISVLLVLFSFLSEAQISQKGLPLSSIYQINSDVPVCNIKKLDSKLIQKDIEETEKNGTFYKFGRLIPVNKSINSSGVWNICPDGSKIWRIKLVSDDALALSVYFKDFFLPANGRLFLYGEDKQQIIGAFSEFNNSIDGIFATELIYGESVTIEYNENPGTQSLANFSISDIGYVFRGVKNTKDFGGSESCEVNVNCSPEGDNWQDQKRGVVRVSLVENGSMGWCSGSLINNTDEDCKPYILSADHCGGTAQASEFSQWVFYFNYESSVCQNPTSEGNLASQTVNGCTLQARGGNAGNSGSDFLLLLMNSSVPDSYEPFYNGWNREDIGSMSGVSIHHPAGDIKKISNYTNQLTTTDWNGSGYDSHWNVVWSATANGHGVTEGGSSGSPIFNADGLIVGDLTGGGSYCSTPDQADMYGKFSYSWTSNGTSQNQQLKPWLDPANTGVNYLEGKNSCSAGGLYADFSASAMVVITGGTINYTDLSSGNPTSWSWEFNGGTPTTSNLQNPTGIQYNTVGTFNTKLTVANGTGTDDKIRVINVVAPGPPSCDFVASSTSIIAGQFINFYDLTTGGPSQWQWTFVGGYPAYSNVQNPTGIIYNVPGIYSVSLSVSNPYGQDYLTKTAYITVNEEEPEVNYCDTITNMLEFDSLMVLPISPWGFLPGHNSFYMNEYADLFENTNYNLIKGLIVPVNLSSSNYSSGTVRFKVWDGDTIPGGVLGSKDVLISQLTPNFNHLIMFDQPIPITGNFFVGYEITYYANDNYQTVNNFAVNIAKNRNDGDESSLFVRYSGIWHRCSNEEILDSMNTSLSITPITCFEGDVDQINEDQNILIFPNPAKEEVSVMIPELHSNKFSIEIYDLLGNLTSVENQKYIHNQMILDCHNLVNGVYLIKILLDNTIITKKLIINK